jgi:hypothetical protein
MFSNPLVAAITDGALGECKADSWKLHSKRVEKIKNYTPNECKRLKTTLETSGEDANVVNPETYIQATNYALPVYAKRLGYCDHYDTKLNQSK